MKADRTVIVFGVFLFLLGLAVAWNGYGVIEVERGWSMVISGTIAFCAGLILIALGLILRQLQIASASVAQSALFLARSGPTGVAAQPVPPPASAEREPAPEAEAPPAPALAAAAAEPVPAPAAENLVGQPPAWMTRASIYAAGFGAARLPEPEEPAAAPAEQFLDEQFLDENRDWLEKAVADEIAAHEALYEEPAAYEAPAQEAPAQEAPAQEAPAQEAPADEAFFHGEPVHRLPVEDAGAETFAEPPSSDGAYDWENAAEAPVAEQEPEEIGALAPETAEPVAAHEPASEPVPEPASEPVPEFLAEPGDEEPAEPAATPAILGQYDANGARYTMYVDGSIDAETPHGVYRFASMEELKRFLEQNA